MNIGDIAVVLTEKDSERLTLRAELNKLEDLQAAGTERLFRVTCTGIKKEGLNTSNVVYSYSIDHTNFKQNAKAQGEVVEFELLTENDVIDIIAEVATTDANGEATTLSFLAQFSTSRVPVTSHTDDTVEVTSTPATEGDEAAVAPATTDADAPAADAAPNAEETTEATATAAPAAEETEAKTETAAPPADKETTTATPAKKTTTTTTLAVDDWVSLSLEAVDGDDADSQAELHVTAKRIAIAEAIAEKNAELESKVAEIEDLKQQLKALQAATVKEQQQQQKTSKATTASSTATKKKTTTSVAGKKKTTKATKKTTNKRASDDDDEDNEDEDDQQKKQSSVAKKSVFGLPSMAELQGLVLGGGMTLLNMAVANRAFVFFGLAALGVYKYGDYASV